MNLINYLLRGDSQTTADLLRMGKEASTRFTNDGVDLNVTLAKMASSCGWNHQQIQRAVEVANNSTFRTLFDGDGDKNIVFPVADSKKIASMMGKVPPPPNGQEKTSAMKPTVRHLQWVPGSRGKELEDFIFGGRETEKKASAEPPLRSQAEAVRVMDKLASIADHAEAQIATNEMKMQGSMTKFVKIATGLVTGGSATLPDIEYALASSKVGPDEDFIKSAVAAVRAYIKNFHPFECLEGMDKRGSGLVVNENHPLIQAAVELHKLAVIHDELRSQAAEARDGEKKVLEHIKRSAR